MTTAAQVQDVRELNTKLVVVSNASASFTVQRSGSAPFQYQWLFNNEALPAATNQTFRILRCQAKDEGDYRVTVRNDWGAVTSRVARLTVAPPATDLLARVFTNSTNTKLPYRLFVPAERPPEERLPLVLFIHGAGELGTDNISQLRVQPHCMAYISYGNRVSYPMIFAAPQAHPTWNASVAFSIMSEFLDALLREYPVDTNRIYVTGLSLGGYTSWGLLGLRPELFAAAVPICGWGDSSPENCRRFADVAIWNFHAADDGTVPVSGSRGMINTLRKIGGNPIYTEYRTGGHGIWANAYATPGLVAWTAAQRKGQAPTIVPRLTIESPTAAGILTTTLTNVDLAGTTVCDEPISQVTWTNALLRAGDRAQTSDGLWEARGVALESDATNSVLVLASTVTWAPGLRGETTFSDTLIVRPPPVLALSIERQAGQVILSWTGGAPPFDLQTSASMPSPWSDLRKDVTPPIALPLASDAAFYRIVARQPQLGIGQ